MNNIQSYIKRMTLAVALASAFACSKMEDNHIGYIQNASRAYVGRVDSLKAHSGNNRLQLSWLNSPDPTVTRMIVYWNNKSDSLIITPVANERRGTVIIINLPEGIMAFNVVSTDSKGNRSIPTEISGRVYGSNYLSTVQNRVVKTVDSKREGPIIEWYADASETIVRTEVTYTNTQNQQKVLKLKKEDLIAQLTGFKYGTEVSFTTLHLPDSLAVDTFYSAPSTLTPTIIQDAEVDRSAFEQYPLPTDTYLGHSGNTLVIKNMFNDVISASNVFLTVPGTGIPQHFTIDMKKGYKLSRLRLWQRPGANNIFSKGPKILEVWGSNSPAADGSWTSWTKISTFVYTKPSGSAFGTNTAADVAFAAEGEEHYFPENLAAYRYLRFKTVETWDPAADYISICKLAFWSVP
jgi:hypothetical protein